MVRGWLVGVAGATALAGGLVLMPVAWAAVLTPQPDDRVIGPALVIGPEGLTVTADTTPDSPPPTGAASASGSSSAPTVPTPSVTVGPRVAGSDPSGLQGATTGDPTAATTVDSAATTRPTSAPTTRAAASASAPETVQPSRVRSVEPDEDEHAEDEHDEDEHASSTSSTTNRSTEPDDDH